MLRALREGKLRGTELEGSSRNWLGLNPYDVVDGLWKQDSAAPRVRLSTVNAIDIADIEARTVNVQAMLLQVGL